ncbi:glycosyl transferase, group 1 family protein [human gut metagenome]|uniref:Glycosyl transferase, group 1 family protein n=1 Tax=human gut metagenome TaxID=408170 RepID=K1RTV2_9ZZZZ
MVMDAYIAGLPLIASDWNINTEVITEKTGIIIPPKDEEALYIAMKNCILGRYDLSAMKRNCLNEAKKYDIKKILSRHFLQEVGLLD